LLPASFLPVFKLKALELFPLPETGTLQLSTHPGGLAIISLKTFSL